MSDVVATYLGKAGTRSLLEVFDSEAPPTGTFSSSSAGAAQSPPTRKSCRGKKAGRRDHHQCLERNFQHSANCMTLVQTNQASRKAINPIIRSIIAAISKVCTKLSPCPQWRIKHMSTTSWQPSMRTLRTSRTGLLSRSMFLPRKAIKPFLDLSSLVFLLVGFTYTQMIRSK